MKRLNNRVYVTLCFLLMMSVTLPLAAQNVVFTVKGILVDSLTQESEPYATVRITRKGQPEKPVKMAVTNEKGRFQERLTQAGE